MKKIFYLVIIALGVGMYSGNLLTNKINHGNFSWGTATDAMNGMKEDTMGEMQHMSGVDNMDMMMKEMDASLKDKTGDEFDREFLAQMIVHHQGAVDMAKQVLIKSKRPELLKLANDIIKAQTVEIAQMQKWQTEWQTNGSK